MADRALSVSTLAATGGVERASGEGSGPGSSDRPQGAVADQLGRDASVQRSVPVHMSGALTSTRSLRSRG